MARHNLGQRMGLVPGQGGLGQRPGGGNMNLLQMLLSMVTQGQGPATANAAQAPGGGAPVSSLLGGAGAGLAQQQPGQSIWGAMSKGLERGQASRQAGRVETRAQSAHEMAMAAGQRKVLQDEQAAKMMAQRLQFLQTLNQPGGQQGAGGLPPAPGQGQGAGAGAALGLVPSPHVAAGGGVAGANANMPVGAPTAPSSIPIGTIETNSQGIQYEYIGGPPSDPSSWNRVN